MNATGFFTRRFARGFSLVEVVMALGICSFCLIALLGLLSRGLSTNRDTVNQTEAAGIARMVQSDIAAREIGADGTPQSGSSRYQIMVASGQKKTFFVKADGTLETNPQVATYRVDISFGTATDVAAIPVYILVTWPSAANPSGTWPAKPVGSFESATAINP
jgi:uncharacterized protein (TIGR02598 family)